MFDKKLHKGVNGIRVWVHKADKTGYTTISIADPMYSKLLRLAYEDTRILARFARQVSWQVQPRNGESWSARVQEALFNKLRGAYRPELAAEKSAIRDALANNASWEQALADTRAEQSTPEAA
jgi:hypothetical protein